jgi:twinkle protein
MTLREEDLASLEKYLPVDHVPHAEPIRKIYGEAMKELVEPFPAITLKQFPKFNSMTGGFRPYEYSILCGSTGTGKTTLCANLSRDLTEQNIPHFVASVETGHTDFVKRVMSAFAGKDWNTGESIPLQYLKDFHVKHGGFFGSDKSWLSLYENRVSVETIMADIAYMVKHHGIKVAFIDNLNFLMEVTRAQDAVIEMDRVTHELIIFCKKVPIHIVMVMHPKKTESGRVDSEFDIKGSSTSVQEAHNIFLFNRPSEELIARNHATPMDRELTIAKMRRRGKYVRLKLILKGIDGTKYTEGDIF